MFYMFISRPETGWSLVWCRSPKLNSMLFATENFGQWQTGLGSHHGHKIATLVAYFAASVSFFPNEIYHKRLKTNCNLCVPTCTCTFRRGLVTGRVQGVITGLMYIILPPVRTPHSRIFLLFMTGIRCLCVVFDPQTPSGTSFHLPPCFPFYFLQMFIFLPQTTRMHGLSWSLNVIQLSRDVYTLHWHCQHNCKPSLL